LILKTKYWKVLLNTIDQHYLGRSVLKLKRTCRKLSGLTKDEFYELQKIILKMENSLKKSFGTTMFNWVCLMNDAYKSKNPKPQVHFHLIPRYKNKVEFAGKRFVDKKFAHNYKTKYTKKVSEKTLEKIQNKIKDNL